MFRRSLIPFAVLFLVAACTLLVSESVIDVGNRKQLFIDEKLIESRRGVELVMNPPYQTGEVLITADQPYEEGGLVTGYSSVLKDGDRVRVWYDFLKPTGPGPYDHERRVAYAESKDGLHFVKPNLGLHEIGGSTANNVVLPGVIGGCAVWIDPNAPPQHRYKTQAKAYPLGQPRPFQMHSSPDGIRWSLFATIDPRGAYDTQSIIFWDKHLRRYVFYGRDTTAATETTIHRRNVRRAELTDLTQIQNTGLAIWPDAVDLATYDVSAGKTPVDYYGATVFPYEDADRVYIMLAQAYWHWIPENVGQGSERAPATQDVRLAVSRDSKKFERVGGRKPFIRLGPAGRFDSRWAWAMPNPIRMGDEIWIYYVGLNTDHTDRIDPAAPGGKRLGAISRAVMRLDGFVSADAAYEGGELTTWPLRFEGKQLQLNLDTSAGGGCRVELLDTAGQPIAGFSGDASPWLVGNSVRMPVTWKGQGDLNRIEGKPVRIRFTMRDCKLYAFQFQ